MHQIFDGCAYGTPRLTPATGTVLCTCSFLTGSLLFLYNRFTFSVGVDNSVDVQPKDKVPKEEDLLSSIPPLRNERIGKSTTPKVAEEISTHQQVSLLNFYCLSPLAEAVDKRAL